MRPELVAWLGRFAVPVWLVPNYFMMQGLAALVGAVIVLRAARADGASLRAHTGALACGYIGGLIGGDLFEALRAIPFALQSGSWAPLFNAGRAAYGALILALLTSALVIRRQGEPVPAYLDRISLGAGFVFALGRVGCFLAGCDYGRPTASWLGVRFPAWSFAAVDHTQRGWVPVGSTSLPVHPTQLYESLIGLTASLAAYLVFRRGVRDGRAFMTWISVYAFGRFMNEFLRGDVSRGVYGPLSTSQYVSLAVLVTCGVMILRRTRLPAPAVPVTLALLCLLVPAGAHAQEGGYKPFPRSKKTSKSAAPAAKPAASTAQPASTPQPAASTPPPDTSTPQPAASAPPPPPTPATAPREAAQPEEDETPSTPTTTRQTAPVYLQRQGSGFEVRAALFPSYPSRTNVPSGLGLEVDPSYRLRAASNLRMELGLDLRVMRNSLAMHYGIGPMANLVLETAGPVELNAGLAIDYTWIQFYSPFFQSVGRPSPRVELGIQFALGSGFVLGGTLFSWNVLDNRAVGVIYSWEPRIWIGNAL